MTGKVTRLFRDKGYGFVRGEDGEARFFHKSNMRDAPWFELMWEGCKVEFDEQVSPKGPKAINVRLAHGVQP
jgi:cold shock CspA family protein